MCRPAPQPAPQPKQPLWRPSQALAHLIRWLARLRKTAPRRLAAAITASSVCTLFLAQRRRAATVPLLNEVPISRMLHAVEEGKVERVVVALGACTYKLISGELCRSTFHPGDYKLLLKLMHKHRVEWRAQGPSSLRALLVLLVPFAYLGVCGYMLWRMTNDGGIVGNSDSNGADKSGSSQVPQIGWDDVAGLPGVKSAVMEVVDVLHRPAYYARLGARCPCGILLAGPPGTGKTLLARAIAGEAGVPFINCTGSDFVEVFVGRGARRVRTLFEEVSHISRSVSQSVSR